MWDCVPQEDTNQTGHLSLELNFSWVEAMNLVSGISGQTICSRELSVRPNLRQKMKRRKTLRFVTLLSDSSQGSCFHWWRCGRQPPLSPFAGSWWTSPAAWSRQPARRTGRGREEQDERHIIEEVRFHIKITLRFNSLRKIGLRSKAPYCQWWPPPSGSSAGHSMWSSSE